MEKSSSQGVSKIFKPLTEPDAAEIIRQLQEKQATIQFKFEKSRVYRLKLDARGWGHSVVGARPVGLPDEYRDTECTCNFTVGQEVYFFKAQAQYDRRRCFLNITSKILQIIRRKNARMKIPQEYTATILTRRIGDRIIFLKGILQDLSLEGALIALNTKEPHVRIGQVVSGTLKIGRHHPMEVEAIVRHRRSISGRYDQIFGIEFTSLTGGEAKKFQNFLLTLQREIFHRSY